MFFRSLLYQLQLKIAEKIAFILIERAWIPAFAGMTRSGNRQSINRIGIMPT